RKGVKGLTLGDSAAAVGLSTTSVTYYFKRKEDLAAACLIRSIEAMLAMAEQAVAAPTPRERVHRLLTLYLAAMPRSAIGHAAPLATLSDMRALEGPRRSEVNRVYGKMFRKVRQVFDAPELEWMSHGRKTARTRILLEQLFWAPHWLPKYDPEDY